MCALSAIGLRTPFVYRQISEQLFGADTPGRRLRTRLGLRRADRVVALWQGAVDVLVQCFGVSPERISIASNGVPAERCPPIDAAARRTARERFGLPPNGRVLLSIGALAPENGVDTFVRAMTRPELVDWHLLIVGAGPERPKLERLAARLPPDRILLHGPVASGADAIAAADVIGLTSRAGDSMPAVLIEAGIMAVPAVATPVEGIVDIVLDGATGRIVPIDDVGATARAIAEVGEDRERLGAAAQEHCLKRFEIDGVAASWHAVLVEATDS